MVLPKNKSHEYKVIVFGPPLEFLVDTESTKNATGEHHHHRELGEPTPP